MNMVYFSVGKNSFLDIRKHKLDISFIDGKKTDYVINKAFTCPPWDTVLGEKVELTPVSTNSLTGLILVKSIEGRDTFYIAFHLNNEQVGMTEISGNIDYQLVINSGFGDVVFSSHDEARDAIEMLTL